MKKLTLKRVGAYLVDTFIITLIVGLFTSIEVINPHAEEYAKKSEELMSITEKYAEALEDGTQVELIKSEMDDVQYEMAVYGLSASVVSLVVYTGYFVIFMYFNKGKTIGYRLFKLELVSTKENNKLSFCQVIVRSLLVYSILTSTIITLLLIYAPKSTYLEVGAIVSLVDVSLVLLTLLIMSFRKDGKGWHDLITSTNVVLYGTATEEIKEAKVVSEVKEENITEDKTNTTSSNEIKPKKVVKKDAKKPTNKKKTTKKVSK